MSTSVRTIALPSSSIIGLVDTFTPDSKLTAQADMPVLLTNLREAAAAFGTASAIYKSCTAIFTQSAAVVVAVGVAKVEDAAQQTSAIIGTVTEAGQRTGLQALLDGKSRFNAQPRLLVAPAFRHPGGSDGDGCAGREAARHRHRR